MSVKKAIRARVKLNKTKTRQFMEAVFVSQNIITDREKGMTFLHHALDHFRRASQREI